MTDPQGGSEAWEALREYVGVLDGKDDAIVQSSYETAVDLVKGYVGSSTVPDSIRARAVLEVGSELYHRKNAPNGVAQFQTFDAAPIRVARDPMVAARPLLAPFLRPGIA